MLPRLFAGCCCGQFTAPCPELCVWEKRRGAELQTWFRVSLRSSPDTGHGSTPASYLPEYLQTSRGCIYTDNVLVFRSVKSLFESNVGSIVDLFPVEAVEVLVQMICASFVQRSELFTEAEELRLCLIYWSTVLPPCLLRVLGDSG